MDTAEDRGMDQADGYDTFLDMLDTLVYENVEEQSNTMRESLRALRTNIQFCGDDVRVVLFTSVVPNEGKSTVVQNLGRSFASSGKKVLVVDSDMRKSVMAGRNSTTRDARGLSEVLNGIAKLMDCIYATQFENLHVLFAGKYPPNPVELLNGEYFDKVLEFVSEAYDYVIIDTAPLGMVIDAAVIAAKCDSSIVVIRNNSVKYSQAQDVVDQLHKSGCNVLGVVLNDTERKSGSYYRRKKNYGYGAYYASGKK